MTAPAQTLPSTPKEWEDWVHTACETPEKFQQLLTDGVIKDAMVHYGNAQNKTMDDLRDQLAEQQQLANAELLERNGFNPKNKLNQNAVDLAARHRSSNSKALYNRYAPGAALNGKFEDQGQFFKAAIDLERGDTQAAQKWQEIRSLLNYSEKVPSEGGVLVPEEYRSDLLSIALEASLVRPLAQVIPMSTSKLKYPAVDFTTEIGEVYGGIVMYWMDEGQSIPATDAAFAMIELEAQKLAGLAAPPNELLRDVAAFEGWLRANLPNALAHFEDLAFLKGNGVKKPLGQLHPDNPSLITVAAEGGQTTGITWINILDMVSRMLPESLESATWVITPDALREVMTMALPVGTGGGPVMAVNASVPGPVTLFGRPIRWSRKAPATLNTKGDISLSDFSKYVIGDTMSMTLESSAHELFSRDKTVFRIIERVDGQPQLLSSLQPENGGPTLSATVQLATRS